MDEEEREWLKIGELDLPEIARRAERVANKLYKPTCCPPPWARTPGPNEIQQWHPRRIRKPYYYYEMPEGFDPVNDVFCHLIYRWMRKPQKLIDIDLYREVFKRLEKYVERPWWLINNHTE